LARIRSGCSSDNSPPRCFWLLIASPGVYPPSWNHDREGVACESVRSSTTDGPVSGYVGRDARGW
jgi:hypothetical protein